MQNKAFLIFLSDEQQFAVLGQGPEAVIHDEFELVNLIANLVEHRSDSVVIGDCFLVLVRYLVGDFASLDEFLYQRFEVAVRSAISSMSLRLRAFSWLALSLENMPDMRSTFLRSWLW